MVAMYQVTHRLMLRNFERLERRRAVDDVRRARSALWNEVHEFSGKILDWSAWDNTYEFVENVNPEFIKANLGVVTFEDLRFNAMLFFDKRGKLVYGRTHEFGSGVLKIPSEEFLRDITAHGALLRRPSLDSRKSGILNTREGPVMVAAQPILTSEKHGPARGVMIVARRLDGREIARIARITHFSITARRLDEKNLPGDFRRASAALRSGHGVHLSARDSLTLSGFTVVNDMFEKRALLLRIDLPRDIYGQGVAGARNTYMLFIVFGALMAVVILVLLDQFVMSRLTVMSGELRRIGRHGDLSERVNVAGKDELSELAQSVNNMLVELASAQSERGGKEALRESEEKYRRLVEYSPDGVVIVTDGIVVFMNDTAARLFGEGSVDALLDKPIEKLVNPEDREFFNKWMRGVLETGGPERVEYRFTRDDLEPVYVELAGSLFVYRNRTSIQIVAHDATDRMKAEESVRDSEQRMQMALRGADLGTWDWNIKTGRVVNNERWAEMVGYTSDELESDTRAWEKLTHPDDIGRVRRAIKDHIEGRTPFYDTEHRMRHKNGSWIWVLDRGKIIERDAGGAPVRMVGTHLDITGRKRAEERLRHQAYHDQLTGLPNRYHFTEQLRESLNAAAINGARVALLLLDLNRFKDINDTLGHAVGDRVLCEVAARLQRALSPTEFLARYSGDEFLVMIHIAGAADARAAASRLIGVFEPTFRIDSREFHLGTSIGISVFPDDADNADDLILNADLAMYRAKETRGIRQFHFFTSEIRTRLAEKKTIEDEFRTAVAARRLALRYQPQIDMATGRIVSVEALVRWPHPEHGLLPPEKFIHIAEETGLIIPMGEWVLRAACAQNKAWQKKGLPPIRMAVNLSARQFHDQTLPRLVAEVLDETDLEPALLDLEITESAAMRDMSSAVAQISVLSSIGVKISIDDFGTGHSSLGYLKTFPIHALKIAGLFVRDMIGDPRTASIVESVIHIAHVLDRRVVAEEVETPEQLELLRAMSCDEVQGFLFSPPLAADDLEAILRQGNPVTWPLPAVRVGD